MKTPKWIRDPKQRRPRVASIRLLTLFKSEVHDRGKQVDPDNELDWFALTIGWAIAKGLTPRKAWTLAIYLRYNTDLG